MALLTDGNPNDTESLRAYESAILSVANIEMIDLNVKLGLATEEVTEDVLDLLLDHTRAQDPQSNVRRTIGVSDVVVTPQLKRWHALHTLEMVYRDTFNNQLNDRYQAKAAEYHALARDAKEHTIRFGIGLALRPIPKAAMPVLDVAFGTAPATTYWVQVSWVAAGQTGAPSDLTAFTTAAGSVLTVTAVNPPAVATGWNVYIGLSATTLALQNADPLGVGATFTLPPGDPIPGQAPGNGQTPDVYVTGGHALRRG